MLAHIDALLLAQVFTDGDVFHFRGNNALFGIVHLGHVMPAFGPARFLDMGKTDVGSADVTQAFLTEFRTELIQNFCIVTLFNPAFTHIR